MPGTAWPLQGWPTRGWPNRGRPALPAAGPGGTLSFAVVNELLAGWTQPGTYEQVLVIDIAGPSAYAEDAETLDLSAYFTEVYGPVDAGESLGSPFHFFLTIVGFTPPSELDVRIIDDNAQVADTLDISDQTFRLTVYGTKTIP